MHRPPRLESLRASIRTIRWVVPLLGTAVALSACHLFERSKLASVQTSGELKVLSYVSPTTYYETPEGPAGFEYDLAKAFAESLGVELKIEVVGHPADVRKRIEKGDVDMAAAGLVATEAWRETIRFSEPYQEIHQQLIYRHPGPPPKDAAALIGRQLEVPAGSSYVEQLQSLQQSHPELSWDNSPDKQTEQLLQLVWEGLLEYTVADSHAFAVSRQFFPELLAAFDIGKPQSLAWAFPASEDDSLVQAASAFIAEQRQAGNLAQLIDRYYGPASRSNFVNLTVYQLRVQNRLPNYQSMFESAARRYEFDWRLLAAMGYQESYWDPTATSPTGVRGMMMLTADTAKELGVEDRLDPKQSIDGGARYLRQLFDRLPERITLPDRLWFALASYNIGLSHVEDARVLTEQQGADPNKWSDVKERLPLLSQAKWYKKTRYGYARGIEPVRFVNRVRTYYDVLVRFDEEEKARNTTDALKLRAPAI